MSETDEDCKTIEMTINFTDPKKRTYAELEVLVLTAEMNDTTFSVSENVYHLDYSSNPKTYISQLSDYLKLLDHLHLKIKNVYFAYNPNTP